jgi:hypothetical protein
MCLARYAAQLTRLGASAWRGLTARSRGKAISGPVTPADQSQQSDGVKLTLHIHRRAIRLHNRSPEGAQRYVKVQTILAKGRCYD